MLLGDFMLDILKSIVLGIVEGITEWLPISSTGHLIIADEFIKLLHNGVGVCALLQIYC